jgi:hypothetical protein
MLARVASGQGPGGKRALPKRGAVQGGVPRIGGVARGTSTPHTTHNILRLTTRPDRARQA